MVQVFSSMDRCLDRIRSGEVLLYSRFLSEIGYQNRIMNLLYEVIAETVTSQMAEKVRREGVERLHLCLNAQQIFDVNVILGERIKPFARRISYLFATHFMGVGAHYFIDNFPIVRFYIPHDCWAQDAQLYSQRLGFLKIQGPHQDTWFGHATEGLNLWMAIGRVQKGNGLSIYGDCWGRSISHDGKFRLPRETRLGRPTNFAMEPGDLLFFHGEHMHASEINVTNETRFVLTNRICLTRPMFKEGGNSPWLEARSFSRKEKIMLGFEYLGSRFRRIGDRKND